MPEEEQDKMRIAYDLTLRIRGVHAAFANVRHFAIYWSREPGGRVEAHQWLERVMDRIEAEWSQEEQRVRLEEFFELYPDHEIFK